MLYIQFHDGACKVYDVKRLFTDKKVGERFRKLKTARGMFERVKIGEAGLGLMWDDEIELCCDDFYDFGKTVDFINIHGNSSGYSATKLKTTHTKKELHPAM